MLTWNRPGTQKYLGASDKLGVLQVSHFAGALSLWQDMECEPCIASRVLDGFGPLINRLSHSCTSMLGVGFCPDSVPAARRAVHAGFYFRCS